MNARFDEAEIASMREFPEEVPGSEIPELEEMIHTGYETEDDILDDMAGLLGMEFYLGDTFLEDGEDGCFITTLPDGRKLRIKIGENSNPDNEMMVIVRITKGN